MKKTLTVAALAFSVAAPFAVLRAQQPAPLDDVLNALTFRNIGPFRTSAWITEIAVPETPARDHLYTIYAASRSGGLWKTSNNGVTWDVISDSVEVAAVGAVAVAPSNAQHRLDGDRRQRPRAIVVLGEGPVQVDRCRQDVAVHGSAGFSAHRADRHPPQEPGRRLRRRDRPPLLARTRSAACSGPRTAARPGRKCCT